MKIDKENLKNEKKDLYSHLWEHTELPFEVIKKGEKDPSYEFSFGGKDLKTLVGTCIARNFGIEKNPELETFLEKFIMACSGSGDEIQKITTMHSSSLCSLLFFFNVNETHPLEIDGCRYTESVFEFKNKVIGYPSNVDVVLLGKNGEGKNVILFLESKFSEFITGVTKAGKNFEIGKSYFKNEPSASIYKELFDKEILTKKDENHVSSGEQRYIEGIKQMISHYYGVRNFIGGDYYDKENEIQKNVIDYSKENDCKILLGTILFDNLCEKQKEVYLNPYTEDYEKLAEIINRNAVEDGKSNFKMLGKPLKYSDFRNLVSGLPEVEKYYFGNLGRG